MAREERRAFSITEAEEIRALLDQCADGALSERRMARARLRRMGASSLADGSSQTSADFDRLVDEGALSIHRDPARAHIEPHPSGNIFRVAVGVTGHPVDATWSAFDQRYQWFGKAPKSVTSGAHLFPLAVDRWRSAVVGLYEAVSAGADRLPNSPDPARWPWALGVRPLAAIAPADADRVDGQIGPQSGLPARVEASAWPALYAAVASSPPPPGPKTLEQRIQELEWMDVAEDVLAAVDALGERARRPEVIERAIELGGWTPEELAARAWYTGGGESSHIRNIVATALSREHTFTQRLGRARGSGPYFRRGGVETPSAFGLPYRPAARGEATAPDNAPHQVDLSALDAATSRHMSLQDELANHLSERGIEARSPGSWQPQFDLAFEHQGQRYVVEIKSGAPVSAQQVRLGVGQILEYCHLMQDDERRVSPVLLLQGDPPGPWNVLLRDLGIRVIRGDAISASLDHLLLSQRGAPTL
jgi:hypothetical protein